MARRAMKHRTFTYVDIHSFHLTLPVSRPASLRHPRGGRTSPLTGRLWSIKEPSPEQCERLLTHEQQLVLTAWTGRARVMVLGRRGRRLGAWAGGRGIQYTSCAAACGAAAAWAGEPARARAKRALGGTRPGEPQGERATSGARAGPATAGAPLLGGGDGREVDRGFVDQLLNVATCFPYLQVVRSVPAGVCAGNPWTAFYRGALVLVTASAFGYHAVQGERWRDPLRRLDYAMVGLASAAFNAAALPGRARLPALAASLALLPLQPTLVAGANIASIQGQLLRRALLRPALRQAALRQAALAAVGFSSYFLDDHLPETPGLHAVWHLCSARAILAAQGSLLGL